MTQISTVSQRRVHKVVSSVHDEPPPPRMMLPGSLKREASWFLLGLAASYLVGLIIKFPMTMVIVFSVSYVFWLLYRMAVLVQWLRSGGKPASAPPTVGIINDMVQLIHREKSYSRKQKKRYRNTLAQFNSLASDLPDATVVLNLSHEIRWSNAAARELLSIHQERDRGQRIDNLIRMPGFREYLFDANNEDELEIPAPGHAEKILTIRKVPTGRNMIVLIATDSTQSVHIREMRKAFVADVSHELRTPLTVIRGYLEMLREYDSLDPELRACLDQIAGQSDRMRNIVEDLLKLSKMEANPLADGEGEVINVEKMIQAMVADISKIAENHQFNLDLEPGLLLLGSENELYSALNNLLSNAVQYTDPGTQIDVSWQLANDGKAVYQVSDNGPGIEARHLTRLSERFYRVDSGRSREQGGTGIGLAIVKHAAQRHGGQLDVESTPGVGSTFAIHFPSSRITLVEQDQLYG